MENCDADHESLQLLQRVRACDQQAEQELLSRYLGRLIGLVRNRISDKLARRLDPDDVVQSAYRSFFTGAREGKFALQRSGDLWKLLAAITLNKLAKQVERHGAARRSVFDEQSMSDCGSTLRIRQPEVLAAAPTASQAIALIDELDYLLRGMDDLQRQIVEMRLDGNAIEEIACQVRRSERTVRRALEKFRDSLGRRMLEIPDDADE